MHFRLFGKSPQVTRLTAEMPQSLRNQLPMLPNNCRGQEPPALSSLIGLSISQRHTPPYALSPPRHPPLPASCSRLGREITRLAESPSCGLCGDWSRHPPTCHCYQHDSVEVSKIALRAGAALGPHPLG